MIGGVTSVIFALCGAEIATVAAAESHAPAKTIARMTGSVALRIPAGDIRARRIEHRPAGVDSNPYLVAATVLAGIRHGLKHQIDPGPETTGDGYANGADAPAIPREFRAVWVATVANMKQNLAFAFVYNALGIPLAAGLLFPFTGWLLSPMIAALAMSLSSASVIGNALRLRNR